MIKKKGAPLPEFLQDTPTVCLTMELPDIPEYRQAAAGLLAELGHWYFWEKSGEPTDRRAKETAEMFRKFYYETFKFGECMCDCDAQELAIWKQGQAQDQIVNMMRRQQYNGTPGSIDPDAPTTAWDNGGTAEGDEALCSAVVQYVEKMLLDHLNRQRVGLGLAAVGAGFLGAAGGVLGIIVGGTVVLALGVLLSMTEEAAADREAIDAVICDMTAALMGQPVTNAGFTAAINSLSGATDNETTIVSILKAGADNLDNYLYFIALMGEATRNAANGIGNCPCDDTWCYTWTPATDGLDDWEKYDLASGGAGLLVLGEGIRPEDTYDTISNPDVAGRYIFMHRDIPASRLTKVLVTFDTTYGTFDQNTLAAEALALNGANVVARSRQQASNGTNRTMLWTGNQDGITNIRVLIRVSRDQSAPYSFSGSSLLKSVRFEGRGPNPFGTSNC